LTRIATAVLALAASSTAACDVLLPEVGNEGEPCSSSSHECHGDLLCVNNTCVPIPGAGEACSFDSVDALCSDLACQGGLRCVENPMVQPPTQTCMAIGGLDQPCVCTYPAPCQFKICEAADLGEGEGGCDAGLSCDESTMLCE
jgi:hypothetical protein